MNEYDDENELATKRLHEALAKGQWDDWLFADTEQKAELLMLNKNFQKQVAQIRGKYSIDTRAYQTKESVKTWIDTKYPKIQLEWDEYVDYIMLKAKLMPGWRSSINTYILSDMLSPPPAVLIHDTPDKKHPLFPKLQLQINDLMSERDLFKLVGYIKNWIEYYGYQDGKKRMPYKYMWLYLVMYHMRESGLTNGEISLSLQANFEAIDEHMDIKTPYVTTRYVRESLNKVDKLINDRMS